MSNKIAVITGGSRGIGLEISRKLHDNGYYIVSTYLEGEKYAKALAEELMDVGYFRMDVRNRGEVSKTLRGIHRDIGRFDVLVNNAGINIPTDFLDISDDDWKAIIDTNLYGPFVVSQEALTRMAEGGSIINIGSVSGQIGGPRTAHYAASKAGLVGLTQCVARWAAPFDIRCNLVAGGYIKSDMTDRGLLSPAVQKAVEQTVLGRLGERREIADVVAFLASDAASFITGQVINVNGGIYW